MAARVAGLTRAVHAEARRDRILRLHEDYTRVNRALQVVQSALSR